MIGLNDVLKAARDVFNLGNTGLKQMGELDPMLLTSRGSMTRMLADYILEPVFIVSEPVTYSEKYHDIIEFNTNMYISLVTSVFTKLVNIHNVEPRVAFQAISSARGRHITSLATSWKSRLAVENEISEDEVYRIADELFNNIKTGVVSNEDDDADEDKPSYRARSKENKEVKAPSIFMKSVEVTISQKGKDLVVPIIIKPAVYKVSKTELIDYISEDSERTSFVSSWHRWRSGQDTFWEFITAKKLIAEDREKILKDDSRIIEELGDRKSSSVGNNSATGIGFARSYGTLIISQDDVNAVNIAIRGKISRENDLNKLLDAIGSFNLIVAVEDRLFLRVYTSYLRGVSDIPYSKLKKKSEKDVLGDLLKSMNNQSNIRL